MHDVQTRLYFYLIGNTINPLFNLCFKAVVLFFNLPGIKELRKEKALEMKKAK